MSKEEKYDDHGAANDMVIEILGEEAAFDQGIYHGIEQSRAGRAADAATVAR
ncbi:MAG TPA: hypothetical protein VNV38_04530 [Stellaceae bacterium]|jgi:hypothetical protein|nr:hypothetical protein [Stellaceae bacterium]